MLPVIYILAVDQVGVSSVAGVIDVFHTANLLLKNIIGEEAEPLQWKIVGIDRKDIISSSGMRFQADLLLHQLHQPGWIYIPGFVTENEQQTVQYLETIFLL